MIRNIDYSCYFAVWAFTLNKQLIAYLFVVEDTVCSRKYTGIHDPMFVATDVDRSDYVHVVLRAFRR